MLTLIMSLWKPSVVNRGNPPKKGKKRLNEENLDQTQTDIRPPPIGNQGRVAKRSQSSPTLIAGKGNQGRVAKRSQSSPLPPEESHCTKGTQFHTWVLRVDIIELDLISRMKTLISRIKTLISRIMTLISRIMTLISRTLLALPYWPLSWVFQDVKAPTPEVMRHLI